MGRDTRVKAVFHHSDPNQHAQVVGNVENLLADETIGP